MSGEFFISLDSEKKFVGAVEKLASSAATVAEAYAKKATQPNYVINANADVSGLNVVRTIAEFVGAAVKKVKDE
jgi:hypothetical protein